MPLWGPNNQSNDAPKWGCELVPNGGSGNANKAANNQSLYNNTTQGPWIPGETDSLVYITSSMISAGAKVSGGPGWYFKRQGSGGRSGRISYEALVSFSPLGRAGESDPSEFATGPAPAGFHWEFVTMGGVRQTLNGVYVVVLVAN